ncbi:MAG TPA: SMP-30/gluconolactonase/LRE family protein [Thermaerobacter sp.]
MAAVLLTALARPAAARDGAEAAWFRRYPLPAGSRPWSLAVTPDGTVWVTLTGTRRLGALEPATGRWRFVDLPPAVRQPARLAAGPDGSLWLTDNDFGQDPPAVLYRYQPPGDRPGREEGRATPGWRAYPLPFAGASAPLATREAVWVIQFQGNRLGRLDPATGRVRTYALPLPDHPWPSTWDLDRDADGRLWTVSPRTGTVYRFDPRKEAWASFALPPDVAGPAGVAVTPDVTGVWVTEHGGRTIGRLDLATRAWVPLLTPPAPAGEEIQATRPNDLEWDAEGRLWVALHTGNALARIDPTSATLELFPFPATEPKTWVQWLARARDGAIWFAAYGRDYVGRVDPAALPPVQLSATAEAVRVAPGATVGVRLALVYPEGGRGGRVAWEVADLPRGWEARWEERGPGAARVRLMVPRGTEAGVYPVVVAARLGDGRVVTRTVRLEVSPEASLPWATLAGFGALVGALTVGWIGVLAGIRGQRARPRPGRHPEGGVPTDGEASMAHP